MIRVLQDWDEIGAAYNALKRADLPVHSETTKCWDNLLVLKTLKHFGSDASIVDLGCGGGTTLEFLAAMGFTNTRGIDLNAPGRLKAARLAFKRYRRLWRPFIIDRGDLTSTAYADCQFDAALCLSTVEHQVNIEGFLRESHRILKPGAPLLMTTDYWYETIDVDASAFGLRWKIFSHADILELIEVAFGKGFVLAEPSEIPPVKNRPVFWKGKDYTFIAIQFRKALNS